MEFVTIPRCIQPYFETSLKQRFVKQRFERPSGDTRGSGAFERFAADKDQQSRLVRVICRPNKLGKVIWHGYEWLMWPCGSGSQPSISGKVLLLIHCRSLQIQRQHYQILSIRSQPVHAEKQLYHPTQFLFFLSMITEAGCRPLLWSHMLWEDLPESNRFVMPRVEQSTNDKGLGKWYRISVAMLRFINSQQYN